MIRYLHHGDRVRIGGFNGPRGKVLRCRRRDGTGSYYRVHLDRGDWVPPANLYIDSEGAYILTCRDCGGFYQSDDIRECLCPNCDRRATPPAEDPIPIRDQRWWRRLKGEV